jgi:hypothetical protein
MGELVPGYPPQEFRAVPVEIIRARSLLPKFRDAVRRVMALRRMSDDEVNIIIVFYDRPIGFNHISPPIDISTVFILYCFLLLTIIVIGRI